MRKMICLILAAALLLPCAGAVSAQSAVVLDGLTGECLYAKNADAQLPMASTTKIMTAITAIEMGDLDRVYTVKKAYTLVEGSSMYLQEGEQISLRDTLYGLMLIVLQKINVNILDISQTVMQNMFTMNMLVDVKDANVSYPEIVDALDKEGERLGVSIRIQREDIFDAMHKI